MSERLRAKLDRSPYSGPTSRRGSRAVLKSSRGTMPADVPIPRIGWANRDLDFVITRRRHSLFERDLAARAADLSNKLCGRRVLIVGGAGSIGSATTSLLLDY